MHLATPGIVAKAHVPRRSFEREFFPPSLSAHRKKTRVGHDC